MTIDPGTAISNSNAEPTHAHLSPAEATPEFTFNRDVLPIFEANGFRCHSARKQKGEPRFDLMEDEQMPPNKPQPEQEDITTIEAWIDSPR